MVITKTVKVIEGTYAVTSLPCPVCAQTATVEIPSHSLWQYNQGALIHNVMPSESDDVRERFISGYCATCWTATFGDGDDDE